jgi:hypothetical protein
MDPNFTWLSRETKHGRQEARRMDSGLGVSNKDQVAALKRRLDKMMRERGVVCTKSTAPPTLPTDAGEFCSHCEALNDSELLQLIFPMAAPMEGEDPTLDMIDNDPFIEEYYTRLRNDEPEPITVLDSAANSYAVALTRAIEGRTFFFTSAGRMGIGPPDCQVGDYVSIIAGAGVPYVLRERDWFEYMMDSRNRDSNVVVMSDDSSQIFGHSVFTVLGESYVHGVMDGSALPIGADGIPEWQILKLV